MDFKDHLEESGINYSIFDISKAKITHLPYSLRVLLENYVRNNKNISHDVVDKFEAWNGSIKDQTEITFFPSRVIMQDFTGVPAVVDLASMRDAMTSLDESKADAVNPADYLPEPKRSIFLDVHSRQLPPSLWPRLSKSCHRVPHTLGTCGAGQVALVQSNPPPVAVPSPQNGQKKCRKFGPAVQPAATLWQVCGAMPATPEAIKAPRTQQDMRERIGMHS